MILEDGESKNKVVDWILVLNDGEWDDCFETPDEDDSSSLSFTTEGTADMDEAFFGEGNNRRDDGGISSAK